MLSLSMVLSTNMAGFAAEVDASALLDDASTPAIEAVREEPIEESTDTQEHEHDFSVLIKNVRPANCEKAGVSLYKCSSCETQEYIVDDALGHDFEGDDGEILEEATCTKEGSIKYTCQRQDCPSKGTVTEPIPMLEHPWSTQETRQEPTCLEAGGYYIECSVCHAKKEGSWREDESTEALGHTYDDPDDASYTPTIEAATCGEAGSKTWHCTREGCTSEDKVEVIPATGLHNYQAQDIPATCTEPKKVGSEVCSVCQDIRGEYREEGDPLGHDEQEEITTPASCTQNGTKTISCSRCDFTKTESIEATGHTEETIPAVEPTCGTDGSTEGVKCSVCQVILTAPQVIPAETNKHVYDVAGSCTNVMREATCTVNGLGKFTCTVCKKATSYQVIPAHHGYEDAKHNLLKEGEGNFTLAHSKTPTCTEAGTDTYTCGECQDTHTEPVEATGHDFDAEGFDIETEGDPDNTHPCKPTTYTYTCAKCQKETTTKTVPASAEHQKTDVSEDATCTEPAKTGWSCSVCGDSEYQDVVGGVPNGHDYDTNRDGQVDEGFAEAHPDQVDATHPATCQENGYIVYTCNSCQAGADEAANIASGHIKKETLQKLPHVPVDAPAEADKIPADCQHNAQEKVRCKTCSDVIETIDVYQEMLDQLIEGGLSEEEAKEECKDFAKTDHKWMLEDNGIFREATCTVNGIGKYQCATCDLTKNEIIPAHHAYTDGNGNMLDYTEGCDFTVETKTEATCTAKGIDTYTCTICKEGTENKSKDVPTDAKGHDYERDNNFDITTEGTSDNPNNYACKDTTYTYECKDCATGVEGHVKTQTVPATGQHSWADDNKDATCTEPAQTGRKCSVCQKSEYTDVEGSTPNGHDYDKNRDGEIDEDWESNGATYAEATAADCEQVGTGVYTCHSCNSENDEAADLASGHLKKVTIPKLPHTPVSSIEPATCQGNAKAIETCSSCNQIINSTDLVELLGEEVAEAEGYIQTDHVLEFQESFREATCTSNGIGRYKCKTCDYTENKIIPGHHAYMDENGKLLESGEGFTVTHTKAPNCTEKGTDTYTCTICPEGTEGKAKAVDVNATGHDFDQPGYDWENNGSVTEQPSCKADVKTYTCQTCNAATTTKVIDPTDEHTYVDDSIIEATCTTPILLGTICSVCGDVDGDLTTVGKPAGHEYDKDLDGNVDEGFAEAHPDQVAVIDAPSCLKAGRGTYTCSICEEDIEGHSIEAPIPATGHDLKETYTEPTCEEGGKVVVTCNNDPDETFPPVDLSEIDPPHKAEMEEFGAIPATCVEGGKRAGTRCKLCKKVYTEPQDTPADTTDAGHDWEENIDGTVDATCTTDGKQSYSCSRCDATKIEPIPAAHRWGNEYFTENDGACIRKCSVCQTVEILVIMPGFAYCGTCEDAVEPEIIKGTPAECGKDGLTDGQKCPTCESILEQQETIPALTHSLTWKVTKEATCGEAGSKVQHCSLCNEDIGQPEAIPATGEHDYQDELIDATCETNDMIKSICSVCAKENPDKPTQEFEGTALGHNFVNGVCTNNCGIKPIATTTSVTAYVEGTKSKVRFNADIKVADSNYTVVRKGLLYVTAAGYNGDILTVEANESNPTLVKSKDVDLSDPSLKGAAMTITVSEASADRTLYGRAFVVVTDKDGETKTFYGDMVSGSFNSLIEK